MTTRKTTSRGSGCYAHENVMMWVGLIVGVGILALLQLISEDVPLYVKNDMPRQIAHTCLGAACFAVAYFPWP